MPPLSAALAADAKHNQPTTATSNDSVTKRIVGWPKARRLGAGRFLGPLALRNHPRAVKLKSDPSSMICWLAAAPSHRRPRRREPYTKTAGYGSSPRFEIRYCARQSDFPTPCARPPLYASPVKCSLCTDYRHASRAGTAVAPCLRTKRADATHPYVGCQVAEQMARRSFSTSGSTARGERDWPTRSPGPLTDRSSTTPRASGAATDHRASLSYQVHGSAWTRTARSRSPNTGLYDSLACKV